MVFLNVLIAIVNDVYARIIENRERYGLMQKTKIYADFIHVVRLPDWFVRSRFLYVITPINTNFDDTDDWSGSINALKKSINKNHGMISQKLEEQQRSVKKDMAIMSNQLDKVHDNIETVQD